MSYAEELAIKHRLYHFVQGDDGFGGEDEADTRAVAAITEAIEREREENYKVICSECRDGKMVEKIGGNYFHPCGEYLTGCATSPIRRRSQQS
jgi:hypothetical protein